MTTPIKNTFEDEISKFPTKTQADLRQALAKRGVIPAELVAACLDELQVDIGTFMIQLLPIAATYARVPISGFHVGAVALGMPPASHIAGPGSLYLGANMEFPAEALSFSVHGEQSATNNAWLSGEVGLQSIAINAAPCGYCRQFLYELTTATKGFNILLKVNEDPNDCSYTIQPLTYYLPDAFGPQNLGVKERLMAPEAHDLKISATDATAQEALASANASYSPYTKNYSGVALKDADGLIFTGRYAENAAYNPSMSPLGSALAFMNMSLPAQAELAITDAVLVEGRSDISQKKVTEVVLSSISPDVSLQYYQAS
ncbi:MAG: cytidine deaminase [Oceanospirillaceae bacterium]|nr:cytidine deaminase [Oceanospirillaceae bacterium]